MLLPSCYRRATVTPLTAWLPEAPESCRCVVLPASIAADELCLGARCVPAQDVAWHIGNLTSMATEAAIESEWRKTSTVRVLLLRILSN